MRKRCSVEKCDRLAYENGLCTLHYRRWLDGEVSAVPSRESVPILGVRSKKRNRQYYRKFDYEDARCRYEAGESIGSLAREYGVSWTRVQQVVVPEVGRKAAEYVSSYRWICSLCGGEKRHKGGHCLECARRLRTTTARVGELQCVSCREWKPDEKFPRSKATGKYRRGRHSQCTVCGNETKRAYRKRNPEKIRAYEREYKRRRRARFSGGG